MRRTGPHFKTSRFLTRSYDRLRLIPSRVAAWRQARVDRRAPRYPVRFRFGPLDVQVDCDRIELPPVIRGGFPTPDDPGPSRTAVRLEILHVDPSTMTVRDRSNDVEMRVEPEDLIGSLLTFLTRIVVDGEPDRAHLHGGAAVVEGRGVLVTGTSGAGKTTLIAALGTGRGIVDDEMLSVDRDAGVVQGAMRLLSIRAGTPLTALDGVAPDRIVRGTDDHIWVPIDQLGTPQPSVAPSVIVLPERRPGPAEVVDLSPATGLEHLLRNSLDLDRNPDVVIADLAWVAARSRTVRVAYEHADDAVDSLVARSDLWTDPPARVHHTLAAVVEPSGLLPHRATTTLTTVLDGSAVIYDSASRRIVRLNESASQLWEQLDGHTEVDPDALEDFLGELSRLELVAGPAFDGAGALGG